jgi:hypothetical protein
MKVDENFLELIDESLGHWVIDSRSNTHYQIGVITKNNNVTLHRNDSTINVTFNVFKKNFVFATISQVKSHLKFLASKNQKPIIIDSSPVFSEPKDIIKDIMNVKYCDFYMVSVDGHGGAKVRHTSYDSAEKEAIRVAKELNAEAFIVGVVASVKPIISHEVINRTTKTINNE